MLDSDRYKKACVWFQSLVSLDIEEQQEKLNQLRCSDNSMAELVSELLHADGADINESFLENCGDPARTRTQHDPGQEIRHPDLPKNIGPYKIVDEIGKGGMGVVYRAYHARSDRLVALKVIRSGSLSSKEQVERFRREAKAAAQLRHTNIVPVFDVGEDESIDYFTMALIEGEDLHSRLRNSTLESKPAAQLMLKVADALEHAHSKGIIHRDIKPSNVLIDLDGEPMLTDFGLAKNPEVDGAQTGSDQMLGTVNYMAPEQIDDARNAGPATDIYGVGATLYHCLTGNAPISGGNLMHVYAYDGDDYVANETDNDMWAFGGYSSDVLIGGDGNDRLDSLTTYGEWWGLEDRNDTDILVGGGGSDFFKSRYDFYKSTTNYYVTIDGKKRKISKSQYYEYLRLNRQPFYKRGSTPRYELSTGTGYRYAGAEIAQVLDYEEGELRMAMRLHDGYRYYNYYY